jgi:hypothetical protein
VEQGYIFKMTIVIKSKLLPPSDLINSKIIYSEIELINKLIFNPCGLELSNIESELASQEYFAHTFNLAGQNVKFRTAKITPTKLGQFVTIWKRNRQGITEPFHISDDFYFYIIATRKDKEFGIFIFPKMVLLEKRILSDDTKAGKRGIRVYPTWDLAINKQAQKTQRWQSKYFLNLSDDMKIDLGVAKLLLHMDKKNNRIEQP